MRCQAALPVFEQATYAAEVPTDCPLIALSLSRTNPSLLDNDGRWRDNSRAAESSQPLQVRSDLHPQEVQRVVMHRAKVFW